MSDHRAARPAARPSWWRNTNVRAVLSLGIVLGVGATGTLAYFTDEATVTTGTFTSGKLDLTVDQSSNTDTVGPGGTYTKTSLTLPLMVPGESVAADLSIKNNNGVAFTYKANAKLDAGNTFPTGPTSKLTFAVYAGSAGAPTGTQAAGNRTGSCSGSLLSGPAGLTTSAADVITTARTLATNASENICVLVKLATDADNNYQDKTATATFVFRAAQLGQNP